MQIKWFLNCVSPCPVPKDETAHWKRNWLGKKIKFNAKEMKNVWVRSELKARNVMLNINWAASSQVYVEQSATDHEVDHQVQHFVVDQFHRAEALTRTKIVQYRSVNALHAVRIRNRVAATSTLIVPDHQAPLLSTLLMSIPNKFVLHWENSFKTFWPPNVNVMIVLVRLVFSR